MLFSVLLYAHMVSLFVVLVFAIVSLSGRVARLEAEVESLRSTKPPAANGASAVSQLPPMVPYAAGVPRVPAAPDFLPEIHALIQGGQMIQAIKLFRARTGLGLKESKDAVDAIRAQMRST